MSAPRVVVVGGLVVVVLVVDGLVVDAVVVGAVVVGAVVVGAVVVAGGRIVGGAVLAIAALVAGGSALPWLPQPTNAMADDSVIVASAHLFRFDFFIFRLRRASGPLGVTVVATVWGAKSPDRNPPSPAADSR